MSKISIFVSVALYIVLSASTAQAEWYLGANQVPTSKWYQLEDYSIDTSIPSYTDPGLRLFSGYKVSDIFSMELEYTDQMKFGVGDLFLGNELWITDSENSDIDSQTLFLSGQSTFNIDESKSLYFRGGLYNWDIESNKNNFIGTDTNNRRGTDVFYSIGSYIDVSDTFGFSAEWERFEIEDKDIDFISTELHFNF